MSRTLVFLDFRSGNAYLHPVDNIPYGQAGHDEYLRNFCEAHDLEQSNGLWMLAQSVRIVGMKEE